MRAGKLRHEVTLSSAPSGTSGQDEYGQPATTFTTYTTTYARIRPLRGDELMLAQQVHAELTHEVTLRHNSNVTNTDRITFGSRTLEVVGIVDMEEKGRELRLSCKEV